MANCSIYENCLNEMTKEFKVDGDTLDILAVGCWGVYCQDGEQTIKKKDKIKQIIRGQGSVSNALKRYKESHPNTMDMFLVGDNVYQDENGEFDMGRQIEAGFVNCFLKSGIERFFLAIGNHDIEKCDILSTQYNEKRWNFPSLYYNIVYTLNDFKVNVIVLDTNMFEDEPKSCDKQPFRKDQIEAQKKWAIETKQRVNARWNIVMGHIPYLANGHKEKNHPVMRKELESLINDISPELYICADEHNQQFIRGKKTSIIVAGSGGTELDRDIQRPLVEGTEYVNSTFGFVSCLISRDTVKITFINKTIFTREIKNK